MKLVKLFSASVVLLGAMVASSSVFAHATYNDGGTGASPVWANGAPSEWMAPTATLPSIGYLGIHSNNSGRVIQTGVYNYAFAASNSDVQSATSGKWTQKGPAGATTAQLGGVYSGVTPVVGDSLLGQVWNYNHQVDHAVAGYNSYLGTAASVSAGANSWANGVANGIDAANTGLSFGNIHASAGTTGNLEQNLINLGAHYLNITVGDDALQSGQGQLAFSLYQGWATGPGTQGLHLLGTVLANSIGQDIGISVALSGQSLNGQGAAGEYTIVVGDQSGFGGQYRMAIASSATALYSNVVTAVPVPGAVWLFGSALAGLVSFGRRKGFAA